MANKRKPSSIAWFVHHLEPSSPHNHEPHLNLGAYHPHLDPDSLSPETLSEYESLLPHCLVHPAQFPQNMKKYWRHRFSLFSLYSAGCLLDQQSWYSVTPEAVAFRVANRCATDRVIVDLFAGAGGNAIQFAMTCARVIAVEIDPIKIRLAKWNAKVYGVEHSISFVQADTIQLLDHIIQSSNVENVRAEEELCHGLTFSDLSAVEAVFLSPPWGGVDYSHSTASTPESYSLSSLLPIDGETLFSKVAQAFSTSNIAYYLPRNTCLQQLSHLASLVHQSNLKIEYQYVNHGSKLSSLTAYYGALASHWDDDIDDWHKT